MGGTGKLELADPEFLVNRQTGLPEHAVLKIETLQTLQYLAVKGLLRELNTKVRPEELVTLLNRLSIITVPPQPAVDQETSPPIDSSSESTSLGNLCISGLTASITDYPFTIGSNPDECSLVLPADLLKKSLLPVHCVIDKANDAYSIETFGACSLDGNPINTGMVVGLTPGANISIAGVSFSFFPSEYSRNEFLLQNAVSIHPHCPEPGGNSGREEISRSEITNS